MRDSFRMPRFVRGSLQLASLALLLTGSHLAAQQGDDDPQRMTLRGLHHFAVHARVQLSGGAPLQALDQGVLSAKLEAALRREGIGVVGESDVRDGTQAEIGFQYLVIGTRNQPGGRTGFVASTCIEAAQLVKLQRITKSGAPVYAVVPTWRSCGIVLGDSASYAQKMLQTADQQIGRFLRAWRMVNESGVRSRESRVSSRQSPVVSQSS